MVSERGRQLPPELGKLASLSEMHLGGNRLSGTIPPELGSLNNLTALGLDLNELSGGIPPELGDLNSLELLYLNENALLTGPLPLALARLSVLQAFLYQETDLCVPRDEGFRAWLGSIPHHEGTNVDCPATDRAALVALYEETRGADWTNRANWLTDAPIGDWHGVDTDATGRVTRLSLRGNNLSGEMPAELGSLDYLSQLELDNNKLTGSIPATIGQLANLEHLWLYNNALSGPIPAEFGELENLKILLVYNNLLAGPLPLSLANLLLQAFVYNGTELCVPADEAFRSWLASIPNHLGTGVDCAAHPDLLVSSVDPTEITLVAGGAAVPVTFTILNGGGGPADSTTATILVSNDSTITTDDSQIGNRAVPGLAASDSTALGFGLNASADASAGILYVGMCVEPVSGETDTDNNCSSAVTVTIVSSTVAGSERGADVSSTPRLVVTEVRDAGR